MFCWNKLTTPVGGVAGAGILTVIFPDLGELGRNNVGVNLVQHLQCVLVALHVVEHALLRRIAPTGVTPHLGFRAQAFDRAVEHIDAESRIDHVVHDVAHRKQMNLRLFKLNDRAPRIGKIMQLFV